METVRVKRTPPNGGAVIIPVVGHHGLSEVVEYMTTQGIELLETPTMVIFRIEMEKEKWDFYFYEK